MKRSYILIAGLSCSLAGSALAQERPMERRGPHSVTDAPRGLVATQRSCDKLKVDPERPMTLNEAKLYRQPDLSWPGLLAITEQSVEMANGNIDAGSLKLKILTQLDNNTFCDAKENRVKAILKLDGGRWLGEARADVAVARASHEAVALEFDIPLNKVIQDDCTLNRDNYVLTLKADFRDDISELDEANNTLEFTEFATASDRLCN